MDSPGWPLSRLDEVATTFSGGTPSRDQTAYFGGGIPWVKSGEVNLRRIFGSEETISTLALEKSSARVAPKGSVLVAMYGATAGRVAFLEIDAAINQAILAIVPRSGTDGRYLFHALEAAAPALLRKVQGSFQPNLSGAILRAHLLPMPPVGEQRKIAAILSAVDDAIESTQAVIDQLQVVKKAMMAELLTRGLPGQHTRFKQTEIGEVPVGWEVVLLDSVARRGSGHTPSKSYPEYWNGHIKWVSLQDSKRLDRLYIDDTAARITPLGIANSSAKEHPAGTVVLSRDAGVGKSAITADVMAVSQHFMAWVCGPRLNNHYLYYWLQHMKPEFERIAIGNTIKTIGLPYFKALRLALPPPAEQEIVAKALTASDLRTFAEEGAHDQFIALKAALMSVLLTGDIRVAPDEDAA